MKKFAYTTMIFATTALMGGAAYAQSVPKPTAVPEISALEGTAAIAVVVAIVLLAWERRRRAS